MNNNPFVNASLEEQIREVIAQMVDAGWDRDEIVEEFAGLVDEVLDGE